MLKLRDLALLETRTRYCRKDVLSDVKIAFRCTLALKRSSFYSISRVQFRKINSCFSVLVHPIVLSLFVIG